MKSVLETFKPIKGFEGLYEISDYGCVRSRHGGKVRYLKCKKSKHGYIEVPLSKNGKKNFFYVHRLVYTAFNGPIPEGMQIDHIDGNKENNALSNLRVVTPRENVNNPVTRVRYLEAIKKITSSEEWRNNQREGSKRRSESQNWRNNHREGIKRRSENQEWRQKNREANRRLAKDPQWRQKNREVAQRNQRNPEWMKNVRDGIRRVCGKPIVQLDVETGEIIRRWECARDAWRALGVYYGHISRCCNGKLKTAGGYRWRFATEND